MSERRVAVVTDGDAAGSTVSDAGGTTVRIAVSVNAGRFERTLLTGLNGGVPAPDAPVATDDERAYFAAVSTATDRLDAAIDELFASPEANAVDAFLDDDLTTLTDDQERLLRDFFRSFWSQALDLIEVHAVAVAAFDVPDEVQHAHAAFVAAIGALVDGGDERLAGLDDLHGQELLAFLWATDDDLERVDVTCRALEDEATSRDMDAHVCPGDE
jgi:hypothetical protein